MNMLFDGIKIGLILSFMIGPIFFALVQTSVEEGFRAGAMVALGIWMSDFLFVLAVYFGVSYLADIVNTQSFTLILGIGGSILLAGFGLASLLTIPKGLLNNTVPDYKRSSSYPSLFVKGFLINTINPFTVFFWTSLMGTVVIKDGFDGNQASIFFGGVLGTIILTDLLKVILAKRIRYSLRPVHLLWLRRISGAALIVFGVVLLVRVLLLVGW
ncbi:MAG TPA: LysE family translocator [Haliscomenobacter sp.]|uniref:LysE family translocator n=1 Tax=Haliscomenobacter sp. TaxID=2717303 RepID=UPI001D28FBFD|nr:LysE family translocator [Haliscomenobacter sp.]MBK9489202.1 LysE family translocator [Haliscomenobacter sp.]HOY16770.1 LysE family translocator [Haliscomenobacter sp.]HPH20912.1 LysE family translocator [Haliscomenobacter sp.]